MNLSGKTALVTGASRGIGRATALALARRGANVAVNCLSNIEQAHRVADEIRAMERGAVVVQADVRDLEQFQDALATATNSLGEVSILVNNAGITRDKPAVFMTDEEWDAVLETNLKGAFHGIKLVSRNMVRSRWGRVINVSSDAACMGDMMRANYAASKAGLLGLTKAMARELAASGVTVNAVSPGFIETDILSGMPDAKRKTLLQRIPQARFGHPEEVAEVIAFLASDDASYITGQVLCIDGGMYTRL